MRVTNTMKEYIHECMEKKVADKIAAAEKAKKDRQEKDSKAFEAVRAYAQSLIPEATSKVVAFAKKQGLTWFEHTQTSNRSQENDNVAFTVTLNTYDFEELNACHTNESPKRKMRKELEEEPRRIRKAVDKATNAIVFSLELGKVKKAELEELIVSTEIEI